MNQFDRMTDERTRSMKSKAYSLGKVCAISSIPFFFLSAFLSYIIIAFFGVRFEAMGHDTIPQWLVNICFSPVLFSPLLCVIGVVYGMIKRHEPHAKLGIILSFIGAAENILLFYGLNYIGSRF